MPTYDYVCDSCGHEFELFQSMKDDPITVCPGCETASVRRLIGSGAGIIFKGTGFYETDYKRKSGSNGKQEKSESGKETKTESKTESKADSKTETKSDSKKSKAGAAA